MSLLGKHCPLYLNPTCGMFGIAHSYGSFILLFIDSFIHFFSPLFGFFLHGFLSSPHSFLHIRVSGMEWKQMVGDRDPLLDGCR
jgi:hypothetical protein